MSTSKSIGVYVYVLVDPLDNVPFYVGKGKGDRVFSHVKSVERRIAKRQPVTMTGKDLKILEILTRKEGPNEVLHYIVRYGLTNDQALAIESVLIDLFNGAHPSALAWRIPWTAEPGGLQSMGSLGVGHD